MLPQGHNKVSEGLENLDPSNPEYILTGREFWERRRCSRAESRTIHVEKRGLYFLNPTLGMWFEALSECLILTLSQRKKKRLYGHWIFTVSTLGGYSYFFLSLLC